MNNMSMGHWWNDTNREILKYLKGKTCSNATVSTTNPNGLVLDRTRTSEV